MLETVMSSHEGLKHGRRKRRRSRKLSDNRELLASVVVMIIFGLALITLFIYLLSTRACQPPKWLE